MRTGVIFPASCISFVAGLALAASVSAAPLSAAAPFRVEDLTGRTRVLAEMRGRVVVVSYWATWCAPCKAELAMLDRVYRAHHADGLEAIAVTNERGLSASRLQSWTNGLALSVAIDHGDDNKGYGPIGGVLPTTYVIDRTGLLRMRRAGTIPMADLERLLAPLLAGPSAPSSAQVQ